MRKQFCAFICILFLLSSFSVLPHYAEAEESPQVTLPSFSYKDSKESTIGRAFVLSIGLFPSAIFIPVLSWASQDMSLTILMLPMPLGLPLHRSPPARCGSKIAVSSAASLVFGLLGAMLK